jgi:hypothetical protein
MVMMDLKDLVVGFNYIHVNNYDGSKTTFRYDGKIESAKHSVTILNGIEEGVKSFLVPGDIIVNC